MCELREQIARDGDKLMLREPGKLRRFILDWYGTFANFGRTVGCESASVTQSLSGRCAMSFDRASRWCDALGITMLQLAGHEELPE